MRSQFRVARWILLRPRKGADHDGKGVERIIGRADVGQGRIRADARMRPCRPTLERYNGWVKSKFPELYLLEGVC